MNLLEEDEFDRSFEVLLKINYEEFVKFMRCDKVKLLIFKENSGVILGNVFRDFIVELKEIFGEKSLY